ncbi:hypothetical protein FB451DRAFT_1181948 [Mycena latifolia]|nr:hypothetical protein FB451DRAFT_1181948 [Mycena latifolia]
MPSALSPKPRRILVVRGEPCSLFSLRNLTSNDEKNGSGTRPLPSSGNGDSRGPDPTRSTRASRKWNAREGAEVSSLVAYHVRQALRAEIAAVAPAYAAVLPEWSDKDWQRRCTSAKGGAGCFTPLIIGAFPAFERCPSQA